MAAIRGSGMRQETEGRTDHNTRTRCPLSWSLSNVHSFKCSVGYFPPKKLGFNNHRLLHYFEQTVFCKSCPSEAASHKDEWWADSVQWCTLIREWEVPATKNWKKGTVSVSQPHSSFIRWFSLISAHFRGKWEGEKWMALLSRRADKATNPAAVIKGEKSMPILLKIAEFNTIKEEKKKEQNKSKYKVIWKSFGWIGNCDLRRQN